MRYLLLFIALTLLCASCVPIKVFASPNIRIDNGTLCSISVADLNDMLAQTVGLTREQIETKCGRPAMRFEGQRIGIYRFYCRDGILYNVEKYYTESYYRMELVHLVLVFDDKDVLQKWSILDVKWADLICAY